MKELKGFQKKFLKAWESKEISFKITAEDLKFYTTALKFVADPGDFKVFIFGSSKDVKEANFRLL